MSNDSTLLILCPMAEEHAVLRGLIEDLGYNPNEVAQLAKERKLFIHETGMGAINILHAIYNHPYFFEKTNIHVLLTGFAGALSPQLHKGDACHVAQLTHFSFIDFQGAGDFELIPPPAPEPEGFRPPYPTPAPYHENLLAPYDEHTKLKLPHIRLTPTSGNADEHHSLISVPALLQGRATKEYLYGKGVDIVDMEAFALASALHHKAHDKTNTATQKNIHLDIIKVITDCPEEAFDFAKLDEYKDFLRKCAPVKALLQEKFSHF